MERNGFDWWIKVLRDKLERYDILRIDHFRGFSAYWSIPFGETTAVNGQWIPSPGRALFNRIREVLGDIPIIAEDLGVITEDVLFLIRECGFPGMKVLQFAFDSSEENDYLPHTYDKHCLVYTGTHDNDTAAGWYESASGGGQRSGTALFEPSSVRRWKRRGCSHDSDGDGFGIGSRDNAPPGHTRPWKRGTIQYTGYSGRKLDLESRGRRVQT